MTDRDRRISFDDVITAVLYLFYGLSPFIGMLTIWLVLISFSMVLIGRLSPVFAFFRCPDLVVFLIIFSVVVFMLAFSGYVFWRVSKRGPLPSRKRILRAIHGRYRLAFLIHTRVFAYLIIIVCVPYAIFILSYHYTGVLPFVQWKFIWHSFLLFVLFPVFLLSVFTTEYLFWTKRHDTLSTYGFLGVFARLHPSSTLVSGISPDAYGRPRPRLSDMMLVLMASSVVFFGFYVVGILLMLEGIVYNFLNR